MPSITLKDLIYVFISVPVSLVIWLVGRSFSQFSNSNGKKTLIYAKIKITDCDGSPFDYLIAFISFK
jgi:hypothetical protein